MILKTTGWYSDMDDNYSVNMLKKAAFVDEVRNYLDIIIQSAQDYDKEVADKAKIVKQYLEGRIEHLTKISK